MKSSETITQWDKLTRRNSGHLKNITDQPYHGFRTENHSPVWWKELCSPNLKQPFPKGPDPRPLPALISIFLTSKKELYLIFNIPGPQGMLPRPRPQVVTGSAKHVPGFEKKLSFIIHEGLRESLARSGQPSKQMSLKKNFFSKDLSTSVILPMWKDYAFLKKIRPLWHTRP